MVWVLIELFGRPVSVQLLPEQIERVYEGGSLRAHVEVTEDGPFGLRAHVEVTEERGTPFAPSVFGGGRGRLRRVRAQCRRRRDHAPGTAPPGRETSCQDTVALWKRDHFPTDT